jgi:two-component system, LytTR family, response regulator
MYKAVLIDDELLALEGLSDLLNTSGQFEILTTFENPLEVLAGIEPLNFDVAFVDIDMPYINGIDLAEQMIELKPNIEVVFVTAYDSFAISAIEKGATGYILKPADLDGLKNVIKHIDRRTKATSAVSDVVPQLRVTGFGTVYYELDQIQTCLEFPTAKSEELFLFLLQKHGRAVSTDEIIENLWENFTRDKAMNNFHVNCYYVRQSLSKISMSGCMKRERNGYMIATGGIFYDVWEFDNISNIKTLPLDDAVRLESLYKEEFLKDKEYPWADSIRGLYERKYTACMSNILSQLQVREDKELMIYFYNKAIGKDPLNEDYYMGLLGVYHKAKQYREMRELYRKIVYQYGQWMGTMPPDAIVDFMKNVKKHTDKF